MAPRGMPGMLAGCEGWWWTRGEVLRRSLLRRAVELFGTFSVLGGATALSGGRFRICGGYVSC